MIKKRIVNLFLVIVISIYILFEELIWERFATPIINYISSMKIAQKVEIAIKKVDSRAILAIFVVIFVLVELLGIYAGAMFLSGNVIVGVLVYLSKIPLAAFTFWLFRISKKRLLEFAWFKKSYQYMEKAISMITSSSIYMTIKQKSLVLKSYMKKFVKLMKTDNAQLFGKIKRVYYKLKSLIRR